MSRSKKQFDGAEPLEIPVLTDDIIVSGALTEKYRLQPDTLQRMHAANLL